MWDEAPDFDALGQHLQVVGTTTRLRMLHQLRTPRRLRDLKIPSSGQGERSAKMMARQSVSEHLARLVDLGVARRLDDGRYVVNAPRFYQVVEDLRRVGTLLTRGQVDPGATVVADAPGHERVPVVGPRLVIVHGLQEGKAFPLQGSGPWTIGRAEADIALDYDPYVSSRHARIRLQGNELVIEDTGSRNGTWIDWSRLEAASVLRAGAVVGCGRSLLVLQL